ncbi:MAG: hypothetical protein E7029_10470 [Planctomycetaceae bacterium]|nr:hypothetical protein [Planctomycetaceae bacterium]
MGGMFKTCLKILTFRKNHIQFGERRRMKRKGILTVSFLILNMFMTSASYILSASAEEVRLFIGSYDRKAEDRGIYVSTLDERTAKLSVPVRAAELSNPGFLVFSSDFEYLYAVCGEKKDSVAAFRVTAPEKEEKNEKKAKNAQCLEELNRLTDLGRSVCHLTLDASQTYVLTAHYSTSQVALHQLKKDRSLDREVQKIELSGTGPNAKRQERAHPHSVKFGAGDVFYVPDLGTDRIMIYRLDPVMHTFAPNDPPFFASEPGSGPRHLCFSPDRRTLYAVNELSCTVTACRVLQNGGLEAFQTVSTLPEGVKADDGDTVSTAAEIARTPDGRFLYVSNRGHDSLACFKIMADGTLMLREIVSVHGKTPRHFAISPTGKYLAAANQDSDSVSLFRIHADSGKLQFVSEQKLPVSPICIAFEKVHMNVDVEREFRELSQMKLDPVSPNWKTLGDYPLKETLAKVKKLPKKSFPEELILARASVETLEELQDFILLAFEMEKLCGESEDRDFIREMTIQAVLQRSSLIVQRLETLKVLQLQVVSGLLGRELEFLDRISEWNVKTPILDLCRGWLMHYRKLAEKKGAEIPSSVFITEPAARKSIVSGIEQALKLQDYAEYAKLLARSLMARGVWSADTEPEKALADIQLACAMDPSLKERAQDASLLLFIHTEKYEEALAILDELLADWEAKKLEDAQAKDPQDQAEGAEPAEETEAKSAPSPRDENVENVLYLNIQKLRIELLLKLDRKEEALKTVEAALETAPKETQLLNLKLQVLTLMEKFEECLDVVSALIDEDPLNAQLYILRAELRSVLGQEEEALKDFDEAISLSGGLSEIRMQKLQLLIEMKRYDEAEKETFALLEKDPENVPLLFQAALLSLTQENYAKALEIALKADALLANETVSADAENAESAEETAKMLRIQKLSVWQFLANFYLMSGEHARAVEFYARYMELDAENAQILNNYAWVLCTSPDEAVRDGKKAVELAEKAIALDRCAGYISTLAAAYAELGDFEKAKELVDEALQIAEEAAKKAEADEETADSPDGSDGSDDLDTALTESLKKERASYEAGEPIREKVETYRTNETPQSEKEQEE